MFSVYRSASSSLSQRNRKIFCSAFREVQTANVFNVWLLTIKVRRCDDFDLMKRTQFERLYDSRVDQSKGDFTAFNEMILTIRSQYIVRRPCNKHR